MNPFDVYRTLAHIKCSESTLNIGYELLKLYHSHILNSDNRNAALPVSNFLPHADDLGTPSGDKRAREITWY